MSIFLKTDDDHGLSDAELETLSEGLDLSEDKLDEVAEVVVEEEIGEVEDLTDEDVEEFNGILNVRVKRSKVIVVKTKKQKIELMRQRAAMDLAKKAGDPLHKRYEKARKLEIKLREQIEKKYKGKARAAVQKKIR